jgi:pimeloyl-ACP methyl ester carboxylesterase
MAPSRSRLAAGLGLVTSIAALAAGGIAMGIELERRIVAKRIKRSSQEDLEEFFSLRSDGPDVITPDGVVLHTEVEEGSSDDVTLLYVHGYGLNLDCWHFQRLHFRGQLRQVFYDQRSHGRSSRSEAELCRIPQLADDLYQPLLAGLNRIPELVAQGRRAGSDLGYVVTKRLAFGSEVAPSYVDFASEMLADIPLEVVADYYPAFHDLDEYRALEILGKVPTAVVGGENDVITPIDHTARMMELLPDAEAIRVENCGHLGMIEKHEIFNDALDALVARVRERLV